MNLKRRFWSALGLISLVGLAIGFYPMCGILVTTLIGFALLEFFNMVENKGVKLFKTFGLLIGLFVPISIYFSLHVKEGWQFLFVVIGLFMLFFLEITKKKNYEPILSISATVFGIIYISWCFSFLIRIRQLPDGLALVAFLLVVTKSGDIGAYFFGKRFGKTSLLAENLRILLVYYTLRKCDKKLRGLWMKWVLRGAIGSVRAPCCSKMPAKIAIWP